MNSKCCVQLCGFTSVPVPMIPANDSMIPANDFLRMLWNDEIVNPDIIT